MIHFEIVTCIHFEKALCMHVHRDSHQYTKNSTKWSCTILVHMYIVMQHIVPLRLISYSISCVYHTHSSWQSYSQLICLSAEYLYWNWQQQKYNQYPQVSLIQNIGSVVKLDIMQYLKLLLSVQPVTTHLQLIIMVSSQQVFYSIQYMTRHMHFWHE